jgi:hypothetical protein
VKHPRLVIVQHLYLCLAANQTERCTKHIRMADVVDHHVIVAGNDYSRIDRLDNVRRLQGIEIVKSAIDADCAKIHTAGEQGTQEFAIVL